MKVIATLIATVLLLTLAPAETLAKECREVNGVYSCDLQDGSYFSVCSPWLNKYERAACVEQFEQQKRAKRFYKKCYDRECKNKIGKNTKYCKDLKAKYLSY